MSLWLIDANGNRYDFIRADLSGFPASIRRNLITLAFAHGARDIGDQKIDARSFELTTLLNGTTGGLVRLLHDMGDNDPVTDWGDLSYDGLTPTTDTTYVKQGSTAMKCGVDADKHGNDAAWWGTISGADYDLSDCSSDWIYFWVYFPTLDYLQASGTCFHFWIGTDNSNRIKFYWTKTELSVGWNLLKAHLSNPDAIEGTVTWSSIKQLWWGVNESVGNTTDFSIYVDDLKVWRVSHQGEFDDLMRWVGKTDLKFYKDTSRYINVESMDLKNHTWIIGNSKAKATLALYCPDPFWYTDDETTEGTWTVSASPDSNQVVNLGNIDVFPVIEITAAADLSAGIELKNETDGDALFSYTDSSFTTGKKLTVDCVDGSVDLDGTNTYRFLEGQFIRLLSGRNTLTYTGGDCSIVIKHRDRWL